MSKITCSIIIFLCVSNNVYAYDFSIGFGMGINGESVNRIGISKSVSDNLYYEIGISSINEKIFIFSTSPMIRFKKTFESYNIFCEFGIGLSGISNTIVGDRNLATNFLFEDKIGIGVSTKNIDIAFRVIHYSNCSIKPPNDGFEVMMLNLTWKF